MKHYYEARKGIDNYYYGVVYHLSNIDGNEVVDYWSDVRGVTEDEALEDAQTWADDNNIQDLEIP